MLYCLLAAQQALTMNGDNIKLLVTLTNLPVAFNKPTMKTKRLTMRKTDSVRELQLAISRLFPDMCEKFLTKYRNYEEDKTLEETGLIMAETRLTGFGHFDEATTLEEAGLYQNANVFARYMTWTSKKAQSTGRKQFARISTSGKAPTSNSSKLVCLVLSAASKDEDCITATINLHKAGLLS